MCYGEEGTDQMRTLLLAVMLTGSLGAAFAAEVQFASVEDCSIIVQDGDTYTRLTDQMHAAEAIPASQITHVDADTIEYNGATFDIPNNAFTAKCG